MARQNKNINYRFLSVAGLAVVLFLVFGISLSKKAFSKVDWSKYPEFPVESYLDGDTLWSNTDYVLEGTFQNILLQQQGSDRVLCSVITDNKKIPLPVIFNPSSVKTPLQRQQKIRAMVRVDDDGRIIASDCVVQ